ncbi:SDR family NAD(P)-dependent oxidoreductase [Microbacterium sp. LWS13-1.2]|uniref:SDR family NAD(P)-dependent oxidoreductase n=1 Tax=Microbacterium sp. LWS13-1.2 TaxID=3135264 RepID=UPI0032DBB030
MRTLQYTAPRNLVVADTERTPPAAGEVQIGVAFAGLCGTDLHIFHGDMDSRVTTPLVFGHEMSGVVTAIGPHAREWAVGDRVTVMPLPWDGVCPACRAGHEHICQNLDFIGIDSPDALQERWNMPASTVVRLPESMPLDVAALVEPVAVTVHDVRRSELTIGDRVVVIGGGPIGVLIASVARHKGAEVVVIEMDERRRSQISDLGFATIDPRVTDQAGWVEEWAQGAGADVVFEVPSQFALTQAVGTTMVERGRGKIIFTASLLSFQGGINVPGYTAAKSGVAGLTRALSNEWAAHGVNVNAIAPGYTATDNTAALQADADTILASPYCPASRLRPRSSKPDDWEFAR